MRNRGKGRPPEACGSNRDGMRFYKTRSKAACAAKEVRGGGPSAEGETAEAKARDGVDHLQGDGESPGEAKAFLPRTLWLQLRGVQPPRDLRVSFREVPEGHEGGSEGEAGGDNGGKT